MQAVVPRIYERLVYDRLDLFPAVAILGPRQCGKTTLAKTFQGAYFDMEVAGSEARLDAEWDDLTSRIRLVIIDEAQQAPWVFTRLRATIDANRHHNGRFLLLGSVSPELMENVAESLAGRLGLVRMTPLILPELERALMDELWLYGGYPDGGILGRRAFPVWQTDYLELLATRDLPNWGLPGKPLRTQRLLAMLAAMHGQPLNASQLGTALALDHKTVLKQCDYLEGAFLIRRLPPYFSNIKKRLVKTPRIYWRDNGLLHALMNVSDLAQLYRQPWVGQSWEGYVIEQTLSAIAAQGDSVLPFFFRTSDGHELDLVFEWRGERWGIEIKLTSNPSKQDIDRLHKTAGLIDVDRRVLVCRIAQKIESERLLVINPWEWLQAIVAKP